MNYLGDYTVLEVAGPGVLKLLHNLTTNVIAEKPESIIYSCILMPNGRFMYDFMLFQTQGKMYVSVHKNAADGLIAYISMYKMKMEVIFTKTEFKIFWNKNPHEGFIVDPRKQELGYYKIGVGQGNDCSPEYHINRMQNLVPDGFYDMTQKESIILEFGLDNLNAVSFTKGCYLGQELISRTKHTGTIRKSLSYFKSEEPLKKGDDIPNDNGEKIGKVLGGFNGHYLGLIRKIPV